MKKPPLFHMKQRGLRLREGAGKGLRGARLPYST